MPVRTSKMIGNPPITEIPKVVIKYICVRIAAHLIRKRARCIIITVRLYFGIMHSAHTALIILQLIAIIGLAFIQMAFRRNRMLAPIVLKAVFREVALEARFGHQPVHIAPVDLVIRLRDTLLALKTYHHKTTNCIYFHT
jgi:hypothetical protein